MLDEPRCRWCDCPIPKGEEDDTFCRLRDGDLCEPAPKRPKRPPSFASFGAALTALRIERKLSQRQLAKLLGHDHAWLSRVESGQRHISVELAFDWARALKAPVLEWVRLVLQDQLRGAGLASDVLLVKPRKR